MNQKKTLQIAAVQMVSGDNVAANLEMAGKLVSRAVQKGAGVVVLPENFAFMSGDEYAKFAIAEPYSEGRSEGKIQDFLAATAKRNGIYLIGGSIPLVTTHKDKVTNTSLAFAPDGVRVARYDKIHLFGFDNGQEKYDEAKTIEPGEQVVTFRADEIRIGLSVCYDLRFPELYRAMGEIDLVVVPSAFTCATGLAHWEVLLRTRAIENQCYVLAPAQGGLHPGGRRTYGNSMVVDPWGTVLSRLSEGNGVVTAEMDLSYLNEVRSRLPALQHRCLE